MFYSSYSLFFPSFSDPEAMKTKALVNAQNAVLAQEKKVGNYLKKHNGKR